jgi:ribokinase
MVAEKTPCKVAVVGNSNIDVVMMVPRLPKTGETVVGGRFFTSSGGKGVNQAIAAIRAGGDVSLIARVGDDILGLWAIEEFLKEGIKVDHVIKDPKAPTGCASIFMTEKGEKISAVASGANANLSPGDIESLQETIAKSDVLLMQLETPVETVQKAASIAMQYDVKVILNPAPPRTLSDDVLQYVSVLTPNQKEIELLTGIRVHDHQSAEEAGRMLIGKGIDSVVLTLGAKGALLIDVGGVEHIPGFKVKTVDRTGVGDIFNGVLAVALAEGKIIREAVRYANAAAALSVTRLGGQISAPRKEEIEKVSVSLLY